MSFGSILTREMVVKLVTWNVNGIRARKEYLEMYVDACAPDVLCVQEIKALPDVVPIEIFTNRGYTCVFQGQKGFNGVLIASKLPMENVHMGLEGGDDGQARLIGCTVAGIHIVNLYCPQGQSADSPKFVYKKAFYDTLISWVQTKHTPTDDLILLGDFNIAPFAHDLFNPALFVNVPTFHPEEHDRWNQLLEWGLQDLSTGFLPPGSFTFWDYKQWAFQKNRGMRIDHFVGTASILPRVQDVVVRKDFRSPINDLTPSDHAPVEMILQS